ncbi:MULTISPECIES: hypothetical protein [unclassified Aminobacter]|uniref:hypothetical protein n=1 Tax=unclassified Aminobacter TaxID=2644704 RepID=UPI0004B9E103|nr:MULTISPECIES: hypothetical protein [unclassified Aminobacter]
MRRCWSCFRARRRAAQRSTGGAWSDNRQRFIEADRTGDPQFLTREYLGNVDALASIARRKFMFVATAFRGLLLAILAYVLLLATR